MILTCPNCSTRFLISAQLLAPEGRRVKCSKCSEVWKQSPDPDELIESLEQDIEDIPESVRPIPEGSSVPAVCDDDGGAGENATTPTRTKIVSAAAAIAVFFVLYGVLALVKTPVTQGWPASIAFYNALGMGANAPGHGVEFDRVHAKITTDGSLVVEGYLLNLTSEKQTIPIIEVTVKDPRGQQLSIWHMQPPEDMLGGEASLSFSAKHEGMIKGAESLHMRFTLGGGENAEAYIEKPVSTPDKDVHHDSVPHAPDAHSAATPQQVHRDHAPAAHQPAPHNDGHKENADHDEPHHAPAHH